MPMKVISPDDMELLVSAVRRHHPTIEPRLDTLASEPLTDEEREDLRGALAEDYALFGMRDDFEPNVLGLRLDRLIERLAHF